MTIQQLNDDELCYGYYVFLGNGDYLSSEKVDSCWIPSWDLSHWERFLEKICRLKANTLMIYLNGHYLPYKSKLFPLIQQDHLNIKEEFFSKVIALAKKYSLNLIAVVSTSGHSGGLCEINPELAIKIKSKRIDLNKLLSPFPAHIRKTKNLAQSGCAQVGRGILCHNNLKAQYLIVELLRECLTIYNQFDGVAFHPPESIYPCMCQHCCELFRSKCDRELSSATDEEARVFYMESYLDFQRVVLGEQIKLLLPHIKLYSFTVPWLFEPTFEIVANKISTNDIIIDWDYNLSPSRVQQLKNRLLHYQKYGHSTWFMPSAGFGFDHNKDIQKQAKIVKKQMKLAIEANVSGIIQFVGPYLDDLIKTNLYNVS